MEESALTKKVVINVIVGMEHRGETVNIYLGPTAIMSHVVIMVNAVSVTGNQCANATMATLERIVP